MSLEAPGGCRVQIDFGAACGKPAQQAAQARWRHCAGPGQAEYGIRGLQAGVPGPAVAECAKRAGAEVVLTLTACYV